MEFPTIIEKRRLASPAVTPQALTWDSKQGLLWVGSRDLRRIYAIDAKNWKVVEELEAPGIPWAAVATDGSIRFTIGEGPDDDRYIRRFTPGSGFTKTDRIACPELTGSYLSFDGDNLYLSQWYKQRILKLDANGNIMRTIDVGAEICGHAFVDGMIYVLRGTENVPRPPYAQGPPTNAQFSRGAEPGTEKWWLARLDPQEEVPDVKDLAAVPFACRSLTFDGENFWSNHRAGDEIISFAIPKV